MQSCCCRLGLLIAPVTDPVSLAIILSQQVTDFPPGRAQGALGQVVWFQPFQSTSQLATASTTCLVTDERDPKLGYAVPDRRKLAGEFDVKARLFGQFPQNLI